MAKRRLERVSRARGGRKATLRDYWFAIVNPRSGRNRNRTDFASLLSALRGLAAKTVVTEGPGHAATLAREAQEFKGVVAAGGDGTLFEILKGLDCSQQRVALVPAGRGNSLARDLGLIPKRRHLDAIHWRQAAHIDLMDVRITTADGARSRHLSASTVALGYPSVVALRARPLVRLGRYSYVAAATVTCPSRFKARIQYGDAQAKDLHITGFVANNTRHIASFVAFRRASLCDGQFDTMEMTAGMLCQTLHNASAISGAGAYEPCAFAKTSSATIQLETPQDLVLDGEIFPGVIQVEVKVLPSALACNGPDSA